jgi:aspartate 1-decarboxylase
MPLHEVDIWNRALQRIGEKRITLEAGQATSGADATAANPVVVTVTTHGYATGDLVLIRGFTQMTEVNGRVFQITRVDANTFSLDEEDGTGYTAETTGGTVYKLGGQDKDRACFDAWQEVRDEVLEGHTWNGMVRRTRLARLETAKTITGATAANPVVVTTSAAHGYSSGDQVLIEAILGMTELNDRWFTVTVLTTTTFSLNSEDGTTHTAYTSAGTSKKADTPYVPDSGYGYRYDKPTDCLRVLELVDTKELWVVEGDEVLTDAGITVPVRYIIQEKDVTQFGPALSTALAARLSVEVVERLTQSNKKTETAISKYLLDLDEAKRKDSQEQSPMPQSEDPWIEARW